MKTHSLKTTDEEKIKPRQVGDPVHELKMLDKAASNYDFGDIASAIEFAKLMAQGGPMLPKYAQGNPGVCLALLYRARHWGIDPFGLAMESYQVKEGAPVAYQASVFHAVLINHGFVLDFEFIGETHFTNNAAVSSKGNQVATGTAQGTRQCIVTCEINGVEKRYETPMLKDIKVKNSPLWHNDPDQALSYYGARAWARRYRPNLMMGALTVEDVQDASPMRDVTPTRSKFAERALAARRNDPEDVEDAQGAEGGAKPEEQEPELDGPEIDPNSEEYQEGAVVAMEGGHAGLCPYLDDSRKALNWLAGWESAATEDDNGGEE